MRILYVEDNPANLFLIKRVAKMGEHEVVNLIDGEEALRKIDMIKPDLILMDIQLAGQLTGLDVVRKLRSDGYAMPIVAVTAYAMVGDRERCLEAGCNEYLSKPLPIGRVVELLQLYQSGVPAPVPPKNDDDSSTNIPILTRRPTETSENKSAQPAPAAAPTVAETPAAPAPTAPETTTPVTPAVAETPAAPAPTAPETTPPTPVDAAPAAPSPTAPETPTPSTPVDAAQVSPSGEAPVAPEQPSAVPPVEPAKDAVAPQDTSANASDASVPPASVTGSGDDSSPVESTSQDTSHPQGTVQAQ